MVGAEMVVFIWAGICLGSAVIAFLLWGLIKLLISDPKRRQTVFGFLALSLVMVVIGMFLWRMLKSG